MPEAPVTANATFCSTLVDEWIDLGLTHAFLAPGSRSTPLALALVEHEAVVVSLFHDERSAAFAALGHGVTTGRPAVVACTSGTAGAHFYAAVIESDASAVPMIVCTADRPPELWGRGAPQTIDQTELYGTAVRHFVEPGPPDDTDPASWRPVAQRLWLEALGLQGASRVGCPGPVHANLSFRDPLTGVGGPLPPPARAVRPSTPATPDAQSIEGLVDRLRNRRGIIVAGRNESDAATVLALAETLRWPLLADHRSGCRVAGSEVVVHRFDALLRHVAFAAAHRPEVVLRIGEPLSSKALSQWLERGDADVIASRPHRRNIDPETIATTQIDEVGLIAAIAARTGATDAAPPEWLAGWQRSDAAARTAVDETLAGAASPNEIEVAREVIAAVPESGALVVSSSMPVRDVEWFGPPRRDIKVHANRGANGIDGVIATATGVALSGRPTICLLGDVAFLHDSSSLTALGARPIDLTIVVIDNDGGGIFSFLPQHDLLEPARYELLFGTPHGTDLRALCAAHSLECESWPPGNGLTPSGVRVVIATTDRLANLALHRAIDAAVGDRLTGPLDPEDEPPRADGLGLTT